MNTNLGYVICPVEHRPELLLELLGRYWDSKEQYWTRKVAVVFSHSNSIRFFTEMALWLRKLPIMPFMRSGLHTAGGKANYAEFCEAETGMIALTADTAMALPGLTVDTLIQYDPPHSDLCVHQLAATCNTYTLFLRPQERSYLDHLQSSSDTTTCSSSKNKNKSKKPQPFVMQERFVPWGQVPKLPKVKLHERYRTVHSSNLHSKAAYKAYLDSLKLHQQQDHFNLSGIVIREVADGFCLPIPPHFKMEVTKTRYETDIARKEKKARQPLPSNAAKIVTSYKRIVRNHDASVPKIITTKSGKRVRIAVTHASMQVPGKDKPLTSKRPTKITYGRDPTEFLKNRTKWVSRKLTRAASVYNPDMDGPTLHAALGLPEHMESVEVPREELL